MTSESTAAADLPEGVRLDTRESTDVVVVDTAAASAVLHLDGAHLTSWIPAGEQEVLWLSPLSQFGAGAAIRGGIPVVGPWFGPGVDGDQEVKHGWLRNVRWELAAARREGEEVHLRLRSPADRTELSAVLDVVVGAQLSVDLSITAGPEPLELEAALHTYLAVGDVREVEVSGLGGAAYLDNTRALAADVLPEGELRPSGSTDAIIDSSAEVTVLDAAGGRRIVSSPRGTAKTIVWNPWAELAAGMGDIPDDSWPGFLCVEPAVAKDRLVALEAGESHSIGVTYTVQR